MIVESLKSHKDIVSDKAAWEEGTLRVKNYIRQNQSQTINQNLSYKLIKHIAQVNKPKIWNFLMVQNFWDKGYESGIDGFRDNTKV